MQDLPPKGGFPETIQYQRYIPKRGPSGLIILGTIAAITTYGAYELSFVKSEDRQLKNEKAWARIYLVPLMQAETDRDYLRKLYIRKEKEAEIMKDVPGWVPCDLKVVAPGMDEPVYYTKRHVQPTIYFLPPDNDSLMPAQSWRGSKWSFKNPPYHERWDWQNKKNGPVYEET